MKEAVKYIVLVIGSILSLFAAALALSFALDKEFQQMPLLLILPELVFILFIITFVLFIVWSFKFSNNYPHKKALLTAGIAFGISFVMLIVSLIVNPIINKIIYNPVPVINTDVTTKTQEEPECFISVADVTKAFADELLWNTSYKLNQILELSDENPDIVTRSYSLDKEGYDSIHFDYKYNRKSKQLYNMSMFIITENTNQVEDFERFLTLLAKNIDPTENFDLKEFPVDTVGNQKIVSKQFNKYRLFYTTEDNHHSVMFTIK